MNYKIVLSAMDNRKAFTKQDVMDATGLTATQANNAIQYLIHLRVLTCGNFVIRNHRKVREYKWRFVENESPDTHDYRTCVKCNKTKRMEEFRVITGNEYPRTRYGFVRNKCQGNVVTAEDQINHFAKHETCYLAKARRLARGLKVDPACG